MSSLYINQQGVVSCGKNGHGGFYLERLVALDDRIGKWRDEYLTPLDHWVRFSTNADITRDIKCEECLAEEK